MSAQRRALGPQQRMSAAQGVRRQLETLPDYLTGSCIAGYWACAGELPLNLALAPIGARDQQLFLPCIGTDRALTFAPWSLGDPVVANRYGIPEPQSRAADLPPQALDLVLVPLLAFDRSGHRIGSGGGYYDTSFAFLDHGKRPGRPLLVGVGYAFQEQPAIEPQPWDVRLDYVATEAELIDCTPG